LRLGVKVVFARFVDYAHKAVAFGFGIGHYRIDLTFLQVVRVCVVNAQDEAVGVRRFAMGVNSEIA